MAADRTSPERRGGVWIAAVAAALAASWPFAYVVPLAPESRDAVVWITRGSPWVDGWATWVFASRQFVGWRPLTALSYTLDAAVGGWWPVPYRLTDLAIHAACGLALVAAHRRWAPTAPGWSALVPAVVLWLHPVSGLVVPHLARRAYALSALLAVLAWLPRRPWAAAALVGAAGLAHEAGFVVAPVVAWLQGREHGVRGAAPVLGVTAAAVAVRTAIVGGLGGYAVDEADRGARIVAAALRGLVGLEPMRTGVDPVPAAVALAAVALAIVAAAAARGPHRAAAGAAGVWVAALVGVFAAQGVFFLRQVYVGVAPWALLVGLAAATPSPWARAAAVVALVAAAWQSPVLRGPDPVQVATWRAHDAVVRDLRHHVGQLPDGARVDVVIPHHRRPSFEALRAADDEGRGQHRGGQALGWVGEIERVRFRSVVVYAVDAPVLDPVAVLEGGEVGLPVGTELLQQHDVELHERGGRTWVAPQQPAPYLYVHDGVRGILVPPSGREGG